MDRFGISTAGFAVPNKKHQPQYHGFMNMYGDVSDFAEVQTSVEQLPPVEMDTLETTESSLHVTTWLDTKTTEVTTKAEEGPGKYSALVLEMTEAERGMEVKGTTQSRNFQLLTFLNK